MPTFPKPKFPYALDPVAEIGRLQQHKQHRGIPAKAPNRLLVATWNLANSGAQQRQDEHLMLIREVLSWFDVIAIQKVRENFGDLDKLQKLLGGACNKPL
jgi:hypothetical protein